MDDENIASNLIDLLPKAELHLHIEGTLEPEMLMQLAKRNKVELPYETVEEVRQSYDFSCLQDLPEEHAFTALDCACNHKKEIFGVGMDSTEVGIPPRTFQRVFKAAVDQGFIPVAHVGEEGTADDVKEALDLLKIKSVDHGNHALDDAKLISRLSRDQTPLTMCPISNWRLKVIDDLSQSPIKKALDAGLLVTINSDDPSYFGGYLNDNYRAVQQSLNLDEKDIVTLTKTPSRHLFFLMMKSNDNLIELIVK